jgi:hypothetical protein
MVKKNNHNSDIIMKMSSNATFNAFEIRVAHLPLLGSFLQSSSDEPSGNSGSRMAVHDIHGFLVAQMLPEAI